MKLLIKGGTLEVEIIEGEFTLTDIKSLLRNMSKEQIEEITTTEGIKNAGVSPHSSKSNMQGKLNAKPRMPI